jgi:hypothetical protein
MRILFIHGFGGEGGGPLEAAMEEEAKSAGHHFTVIRWASGRIANAVRTTFSQGAAEVLADLNPFRSAVRVLIHSQSKAGDYWNTALANVTNASLNLVGTVRALERRKEPFSVISFSLGARVLLMGLQHLKEPPQNLCRAVFAGAAVSTQAFRVIPNSFRANRTLVNVYSESDQVLSQLFAYIHGLEDPAGIKPLRERGFTNVKVVCGHLSYKTLSGQLVQIASEGKRANKRSLIL